jgi:hypothetical protein
VFFPKSFNTLEIFELYNSLYGAKISLEGAAEDYSPVRLEPIMFFEDYANY